MSLPDIESVKELCRNDVLKYHPDFLRTDNSLLEKICNGCGSAKAKFDFVPDTIYGLSVSEACIIHDFDYFVYNTENERMIADQRFLSNMLRLIERWNNAWYKKIPAFLMRRRAFKYYEAVRAFGSGAFAEKGIGYG